MARRVAKAGFVAPAPDRRTLKGGYPGNDQKGRALPREAGPEKLMYDCRSVMDGLQSQDVTTDKVGCTGWCDGGGVPNAAAIPDLVAAVPFFGQQGPGA